MTLTCDLDLELAWLWVLHIDSLRRTFDQCLMKIFQRVQEIWSGQESVTEGLTDGWTDRWTDEGHFYNPPSASRCVCVCVCVCVCEGGGGGGIKKNYQCKILKLKVVKPTFFPSFFAERKALT